MKIFYGSYLTCDQQRKPGWWGRCGFCSVWRNYKRTNRGKINCDGLYLFVEQCLVSAKGTKQAGGRHKSVKKNRAASQCRSEVSQETSQSGTICKTPSSSLILSGPAKPVLLFSLFNSNSPQTALNTKLHSHQSSCLSSSLFQLFQCSFFFLLFFDEELGRSNIHLRLPIGGPTYVCPAIPSFKGRLGGGKKRLSAEALQRNKTLLSMKTADRKLWEQGRALKPLPESDVSLGS